MSLYELNRYLEEATARMEGRELTKFRRKGRKRPNWYKTGDFAPKKGKWVSMNGAPVFINAKGKAIVGPEGALKNANKPQADQAQEATNKILGGDDHGFETKENDKGELEMGHEDTDEKVKLKSGRLIDVLAGMMSYVDLLTATAIKLGGMVGRKLEQAAKQLDDAVQEWTSKG